MKPSATGLPEVEILSIGDELLLGQIADNNSVWLARMLAEDGIRVSHVTVVGDDAEAIASAVVHALDRTGTVICTGGLGPTGDDLTRPALAKLFRRPLRLDPVVLELIEARFRERGRVMPAINKSQARVPEGAHVFHNSRGTAPGFALEDQNGGLAVVLPGVPFEMRTMFRRAVRPFLLNRSSDKGRVIRHRVLRSTGVPESELAERLAGLDGGLGPVSLAFLPSVTGVDLRLTSWGERSDKAALQAFDAAEQLIRERLGCYVYGTDNQTMAGVLGGELRRRGLTVALAESCTAGLVSEQLGRVPGASDYLLGSVVAYSDSAKRHLLGVDADVLERCGAVSQEVLRLMLAGARRVFESDTAIAVTGIAGPAGGTLEKPVGTVWIGASSGQDLVTQPLRLPGSRRQVQQRAAQAALALLWQLVRQDSVAPDGT